MAWNLFLAAVPAVAAWLFARAMGRDSSTIEKVGWFLVWLIFLPNAPYIITDFVHLTPRPGIPFWYDTALLVSCAGTGLLLGYTSIADVQFVIALPSATSARVNSLDTVIEARRVQRRRICWWDRARVRG
jgi:uncharacterized membrane protein